MRFIFATLLIFSRMLYP